LGQDPDSGKVYGYDVALWEGAMNRTREWVAIEFSRAVASKDEAGEADFKELLLYLGTERETVEPMPFDVLQRRLEEGTLDVGLCGMIISGERLKRFTFLPPYLHTSLTTLVKKQSGSIPLAVLLNVILGQTDEFAIFSLQLLMILAIIFAHCIWRLERKVNTKISERYADGLWDSLWLAVVTATTVGYGDKSPVTYTGKLLTIGWMIMGMFFVSLFVASITTALLNTRESLTLQSSTIKVETLDEMAGLRIGTWMGEATAAVKQEVTGATVTEFQTQKDAADALVGGEIDVMVEDEWRAKYLVNMDHSEYHGKIVSAQLHLSEGDIGVGVKRDIDPMLMRALSVGFVDHTRGQGLLRFQGDRTLWFADSDQSAASAKLEMEQAIADTLSAFNTPVTVCLTMLLAVWLSLVLYSNWRRIMAADRRQKMREAMNLSKGTFSNARFVKECGVLYRSFCSNGRSQPTAVEVVQKLSDLGQRVSLKDVTSAVEEVARENGEKLKAEREWTESVVSAKLSRSPTFKQGGGQGIEALKKTIVPGLMKKDTFKSVSAFNGAAGNLKAASFSRAGSWISTEGSTVAANPVHDVFNVDSLLVSEEVFVVIVRPLVMMKEMDQEMDDSHRPCLEHHIVDLRDDMTKKMNNLQKKLILELVDMHRSDPRRPPSDVGPDRAPAGPKLRDVFDGWRLCTLDAQVSRETDSNSVGIARSTGRRSVGASPKQQRRVAGYDAASAVSSKSASAEGGNFTGLPNNSVTPASPNHSHIVSTSTPPLWGVLDSRLGAMAFNTDMRKQAVPGGGKATSGIPQMLMGSLSAHKQKAGAESTFSTRGSALVNKVSEADDSSRGTHSTAASAPDEKV